jgi:hypothetical protein
VASSSKATSRRSKAETKESKSTIKAKGKTKAKAKTKVPAAAAGGGEDVEMHDGDKEAVGVKSDPPEEDNDSGEEELEERKAASKRCVFNFLYFHCSYLLPNYHFIARKLPWIGEMRWMWKVGKSVIRTSSC